MKPKIELVLVEDDSVVCEEIITQVDNSDDFILIYTTNDYRQALTNIVESSPDAVILDLELHQGYGSGLNLLYNLQNMDLQQKPYVLVTTNNSSSTTYEAARNLGADYIMSKHQEGYSVSMVLDFLRIMQPVIKNTQRITSIKSNTTETNEQYIRRIQRRIMNELNLVGINPKAVGYVYLAEAIQIMMKQPTPNLCTAIAIKYQKSEASVERAMQNAINRAWKTSSIEDLLCQYTAKINLAKGNPTITEFICYYANKLKIEY